MSPRISAIRRTPASRAPAVPVLLLLLLLLAVVVGAAAAGPAAAAPTEPTLTLTELRTMLDADPDGSLPGHFKTVLKGDTVTEIPCDVTGVVDGLLWDNSALILFAATGPDIERIGGIAAGMSGSPLFVDDAGTDKLVGAVSYGDWFTTNGLGLATPIEYMAEIESDHMGGGGLFTRLASGPVAPLRAQPLERPVEVDGRDVTRIQMARTIRDAEAVAEAAPAGTSVMAPLLTVGVGGLNPDSRAYKHLARRLEKQGVNVRVGGHGGVYEDFETPLVGGGAVGAAVGYGDYWIAAMGTITYVHDDVVVAFGHPFWYEGDTSLFLTNAYVHDVWSSLIDPWKIMTLGKVRGEITQDRAHGIAGVIGEPPATAEITGSATLQPAGTTVTAQTLVPTGYPWIDWMAGEIAWGTAYMPADEVVDGSPRLFNAETTLHVVVNDGSQDLEVTRNDMMGSMWWLGWDAYEVTDYLLSNPNGTAPATLVEVDYTSNIVLEDRWARVLDAQVSEPLHTGDNTVVVTVRRYGQIATETRDLTLTIPAGTGLRGRLFVYGGGSGSWMYDDDTSSGWTTSRSTREIEPPPTVADIVADISEWGQENDLVATFYPDREPPDLDGDEEPDIPETTVHCTDIVSGGVSKRSPRIFMMARPRAVERGDRARLRGYILSGGDPGTVAIYRVKKDGARVLVGPARVEADRGLIMFTRRTPRVRHATRFVAVWSGNENHLAAAKACVVKVKR